jgi:DNA-binding IclR family transcriptional regulator
MDTTAQPDHAEHLGHGSGGIQSVERAVAVLKLFGENEPELGVTEVARRLKLHKSTISRLLSTLEAGGFVQQDPRNGRYRLGLQLAALAGLALTQYDVRDLARPLLHELAVESGETTTISVLDGDWAVNIDQVLAPNPVKHLGWIGRRLPLHCTAAGRPLLAFQPAPVIDRILAQPLARYTPRTITNPMLLRRELDRTRQLGYTIAQEEYEAELSAVGAIIRDHRGDPAASITISGPSYRLPPQRLKTLADEIRLTADRISAQLGHRGAGSGLMSNRAGASGGTRVPITAPRVQSAAPREAGPRPQTGVAGPVFGN